MQSTAATGYFELRHHELRRTRMQMIDGHLAVNVRTAEGGISARVHEGGYWGFASETEAGIASDQALERVLDKAARNARAMARFGTSAASFTLPDAQARGEHAPAGLHTPLTPAECVERLAALHVWCAKAYPALKSSRFVLHDEHHAKRVETGTGSAVTNTIARASLGITFVTEDERGAPVELYEPVSAKGSVADLDLSIETLAPLLDELHAHLQAKRRAVPARGGLHTVVLAPDMAGILAHEAMGHPCEADIVLGGAITGGLLGQRIASDLVTMVDFAHAYDGAEVLMPVYADDEGVPARDAVLIERGVLCGLMSSRETAARLGIEPTGSARAYGPHDEPLVRMRNTAILPGTSKLERMIADVDDGYLLLKTGNGQADSTTEFMFGVNLGYEVKGGRLGRAIRDTTVSGTALEVLASVDAVSDDMRWTASGYCGKKQPMVVSMGGPALRARAHLGGE